MRRILIIISVFFHNSLYANEFVAKFNYFHFDYTEFGLSGNQLNRETGWLPGIELQAINKISENFEIKVFLINNNGVVDYDGQTNAGTAFTTISDAHITRIGIQPNFSINKTYTAFISAVQARWERNIRDTNNITGLYEVYSWWEMETGLNSILWEGSRQTLTLSTSLLYSLKPEIYIDLSRAGRGTATLQLGAKPGARLDLAWKHKQSTDISYGINTILEYWEFGRSNTNQTTGLPITFVTEPRSKTQNFVLLFSVSFAI